MIFHSTSTEFIKSILPLIGSGKILGFLFIIMQNSTSVNSTGPSQGKILSSIWYTDRAKKDVSKHLVKNYTFTYIYPWHFFCFLFIRDLIPHESISNDQLAMIECECQRCRFSCETVLSWSSSFAYGHSGLLNFLGGNRLWLQNPHLN